MHQFINSRFPLTSHLLSQCTNNRLSFKLLDNFLFYLFDGHFLVMEFLCQEGLLLTYRSPNTMPINKTVQKRFMANGFATAKTGKLGQNFRNFLCYEITRPILALNKVWIKGFG